MGKTLWSSTRSLLQARMLFGGTLALAVAATPAALSQDAGALPIVRVEEDWRLVLNEPNESADCPQFHTVMSPTGNVDSYYAEVLWNHRETPDYASGGVQLRSWYDELLLRRRSVEYRTLSTAAETITWTQAMQADVDMLTFWVLNGNSTTWGAFGRDMVIDVPTGILDLAQYSPTVSAANTCITYGANRVESLRITAVRYYGPEDVLLREDLISLSVYELGDHELAGTE